MTAEKIIRLVYSKTLWLDNRTIGALARGSNERVRDIYRAVLAQRRNNGVRGNRVTVPRLAEVTASNVRR